MAFTQFQIKKGSRGLNVGPLMAVTQVPVNLTGSGDTTLVTAIPSRIIRVHKLLLVGAAASNVRLWSGPSSEADSITGQMNFPAGWVMALDLDDFTMVTGPGKALVWASSEAIQTGGLLVYSVE